ncbi:MAG: glycosyltransferase, partial [Terrimesophilobacter sp.]
NAKPLRVTANFEQATLACTGDLIALSDQDDLWMPERLERMVAQFDSRPELTLLHSDARLVDGDGKPLGASLTEAIGFSNWERERIHHGGALDVLLRRNVVTGATTMFRRNLLDSATPFPTEWVHDEWLAMVAAITGRVDFLPAALTDYRQHEANQIGAAKPTLSDKVSRVREPRTERNRRLLARATVLDERVPGLAGEGAHRDSPSTVLLVRRKLAHERFRSGLSSVRVFRLLPILWHAASGAYRRFGRARYDILRDLLQRDS